MQRTLALIGPLPALVLPPWGERLGAETTIWEGQADSNWNVDSNWSNRQVPGANRPTHAVVKGKEATVSIPTPLVAMRSYSPV